MVGAEGLPPGPGQPGHQTIQSGAPQGASRSHSVPTGLGLLTTQGDQHAGNVSPRHTPTVAREPQTQVGSSEVPGPALPTPCPTLWRSLTSGKAGGRRKAVNQNKSQTIWT